MTTITKRHVLVLFLCATMVFAAGCAGWGTDGPATDDPGDDNGTEQAPNETTGDSAPNDTTQNTTEDTDTNTTEPDSDSSDDSDGSSTPKDSSSDESASGESDTPASDNTADDGAQSPTEDSGPDSDTDDSPDVCQTCDSPENDSEPAPTEPNETAPNESEPSEPETHTLTVSVTDENGDPVEGANVSVATYDGGADVASGTTNSEGKVTFTVENGSYEVLVDHADYSPNASDERLVDVDGEDTTHTVTLSADSSGNESDTATGIIKVVDENGEPIAGEPVTITPPGAVQDSAKETVYTNDDGEYVIELLAGEPTDVVMHEVEVRGETQRLGIMSDEHIGVQEVVFEVERNPGEYTYSYTVQVVDENGHPVEGEDVRIGTPGEGTHDYTTNQHGEVSDSFMNSAKGDVVEQEIIVRGESYVMHVERGHQSKVIEVSNESATGNETGNESVSEA